MKMSTCQTRIALSRVHSSAKAADTAKKYQTNTGGKYDMSQGMIRSCAV